VELNLHRQIIYSLLLAAREKEKLVFFTKLNAFCTKDNNISQSWPTVQLAVALQ